MIRVYLRHGVRDTAGVCATAAGYGRSAFVSACLRVMHAGVNERRACCRWHSISCLRLLYRFSRTYAAWKYRATTT